MKKLKFLAIVKELLLIRLFGHKIPLFISWQITERCNLRCKYCDYWGGEKEKELNTKDVFTIIDDLARLGTFGISFTGGEPLLRDDIGEIIVYARRKGITTKINTNGLLVPQKIKELQGVEQVNLSFDGPESIHDKVRGNGAYKALFLAVEALKKNNKKVVFHAVLSNYNLSAIDFILDKCKEFKIGVFFQPATELFLLNKENNPHSPDKENYKKAMLLLLERKRSKNNYICNSILGLKHLASWPHPKRIYCSAGRVIFRINSLGQLYHCERFLNTNKISCLEDGVKSALNKIQPLACDQCWCGPLVELNLAISGKLDAVTNGFKL